MLFAREDCRSQTFLIYLIKTIHLIIKNTAHSRFFGRKRCFVLCFYVLPIMRPLIICCSWGIRRRFHHRGFRISHNIPYEAERERLRELQAVWERLRELQTAWERIS